MGAERDQAGPPVAVRRADAAGPAPGRLRGVARRGGAALPRLGQRGVGPGGRGTVVRRRESRGLPATSPDGRPRWPGRARRGAAEHLPPAPWSALDVARPYLARLRRRREP